ncbi:MAG TPA: helix-turn-helix transcriptional regulator [Polyangiaceae bacterium]|jgi:DNA-binding CsgD family transcriptional regulator
MARELISVLETVYGLELDAQAWLRAVVESVAGALGEGLGAMALSYDRDGSERRTLGLEGCGALGQRLDIVGAIGVALGQERLSALMDRPGAASASQLLRLSPRAWSRLPAIRDFGRPNGFQDLWQINAVNPNGEGCLLGAPMRRARWLTRAEASSWSRVAAHLASALRLRRALGIAPAASAFDAGEAVLDTAGRTVHAERAASSRAARERLRAAAATIDRVRTRKHRTNALGAWKAMVDARWTLVDRFDRDGRRFFVAYKNDVPMGDARRLTQREQQVVAFAALGSTSKLIAYELGLSVSTVTTTLASASRKLGVRSRAELVVLARAMLGPAA